MRAVSFLGDAAFCTTGSAPAVGANGAAGGVGFSGTVGRTPSDGGFGGGMPGAMGLEGGTPTAPGGRGGPGGPGGGAPALPVVGSLLVSFFGAVPSGAAGFPGTLIRTVSRFTADASLFGGSVMRMVSFFVASSFGSVEDSSAINFRVVWRCISPVENRVKPFNCHHSQMPAGTFSCSYFCRADSVRG